MQSATPEKATHSIVFPVFNEEETLPRLFSILKENIYPGVEKQGDRLEVILVNDGSRDSSQEILEKEILSCPFQCRVIRFSRNFGHQVAITAGMDVASGDTVTVMDADLQDPPRVVFDLIQKWREGFDVVYAVRSKRMQESFFKKITATLYYRILRAATEIDIPLDTGDFRLMSRRAINALNSLRERHRLIRGMAKWIGFKEGYVYYVREARFAGETKYTLMKMMKLAWDGLTGFSLLPLRLATFFGLFTSFGSLLVAAWVFYLKFFTHHTVTGWASLMVVTLFLGGVQLFTVGVLGEYVGRIFEQIKQRPLYVVESETTNSKGT